MSLRNPGPPEPSLPSPEARRGGGPADRAYRRAWWAVALYPVSFVAAFVVGEGLLSVLTTDSADPTAWQVLAAATPALLVFCVPGLLAVVLGRTAIRLGRKDGAVPAVVGGAIAIGFVLLNVVPYAIGRLVG